MLTTNERPARRRSVRFLRLVAAVLLVATAGVAHAATSIPPDDRILAIDQYTSEKGRVLARTYAPALRALNAGIYHCMPWVEVQKQSIGFFKPKHVSQDDRYLSVRIYIEQEPSAAFSRLPVEERASAMFSRYVGDMLRRISASGPLMADASVDGFSVILEWLKQAPTSSSPRPIHETIAVFVDRPTATAYLSGGLSVRDLAARARVLAWDGETALGSLRLAAWDDNFVSTYKVKNYELQPGVTCP
jgi:hypothetical protein